MAAAAGTAPPPAREAAVTSPGDYDRYNLVAGRQAVRPSRTAAAETDARGHPAHPCNRAALQSVNARNAKEYGIRSCRADSWTARPTTRNSAAGHSHRSHAAERGGTG